MNDQDTGFVASIDYETALPAGAHWSFRLGAGSILRLSADAPRSNVGMLLYHAADLAERYNAPDTLKAQHTFKLHAGHCLYSDMGRVLASIVEDDVGWHDTVCGNSREHHIDRRFGARDYQRDRNAWHQNGHDACLVELAKHGLSRRDLAANVNWFSRVVADGDGALSLDPAAASGSRRVTLRSELDLLVVLHTCPHPLDDGDGYPTAGVRVALGRARALTDDDPCRGHCEENRRGFENNRLYALGRDERRPAAGAVA